MTDDKKKPTPVQINFRADPDLRKRFEAAVFDYGYLTRRRLTQNQVLVELAEDFVQKVAELQSREVQPDKENKP